MKLALAIAALLCANIAFANHDGKEHAMPAMPPMPKEFDSLKNLVGTWEGKANMHGKDETVTVTYALTSGGTAIVETLMPGTPHEMVSIYHREGKTLAMTHYCSMGNQPHMTLKSADAKGMTFEMSKPQGVASIKEMHMHGVKMAFVDADTLQEDWTSYMDGKNAGGASFTLKRKK